MRYSLIVSVAAGAALLALYGSFVEVFVTSNLFAGATVLEIGIFVLQFLKMATVVSVKRLRSFPSITLVDIIGGELIVLLPGLVVSDLAFGVTAAPSLMVQILLAWVAGVAVFGTPFAIYRLARAMVRGEVLLAVLPSAVFLSELMILLVAGANAAASSGLGLPGLSRAILLVGGGVSTVGSQVSALTALPPLVILYVSLLLYALAPWDLGRPAGVRGLAAVGLLATAVTYVCVYAAALLAVSLSYVVLPSALVTSSVIWWVARES